MLEVRQISRSQIIYADHLMTFAQQRIAQMRSKKSSRTRH